MKGNMGGMIQVELTGADLARTLKAVNDRHIPLFQLDRVGELTAIFWVHRKDYPGLAALCKKRGDQLRTLKKQGLYWTGLRLLRRPILLAGMLLLAALSVYLPGRVLLVRVDGNVQIPARRIIAAAEDCGIGFGASRRQVRSEKVKNALLGAIPELQWAGVNTSGCTAVISVRERASSQEAAMGEQAESIIADRDGFILSGDVTRGTALFQHGQTVRKGQTLISGYTDCGICIRATGAEGEIFAQTRREMEAVTPSQGMVRTGIPAVRRKYSLLLRKKRINLWKDSGICGATCGRMYREFYITLPGGFRLPAALCIEEYTSCEMQAAQLDQAHAEEALGQFAADYLKEQMVSGDIQNQVQTVSEETGRFRLTGTYICTEMIGRVQKIGETNGKRD